MDCMAGVKAMLAALLVTLTATKQLIESGKIQQKHMAALQFLVLFRTGDSFSSLPH